MWMLEKLSVRGSKMEIYIVTMYRYGNRESHSYLLGAWSTLELAKLNANTEILWRGNKYFPEIIKVILDEDNDLDTNNRTVITLGDMK